MVGTRCSFLFVVRCGWCSGQARGNRSPDRLPARFHNSPHQRIRTGQYIFATPGSGVSYTRQRIRLSGRCAALPRVHSISGPTREPLAGHADWPSIGRAPTIHSTDRVCTGQKTDPPRDLQVNRSCALGPEHTATRHYLLHSYTPGPGASRLRPARSGRPFPLAGIGARTCAIRGAKGLSGSIGRRDGEL